jgi:gliding motility-associated-like protein
MNKFIRSVILVVITGVTTIGSSKLSAQCSYTLGNDTSFCEPSTLTLNGPAAYSSYYWSPGGFNTQSITVSTTGTYILSTTLLGTDLVVNGDFSAGNTGFTTSYNPPAGGTWGPLSIEGTCMVSTNPFLTHSNFMSFGDHTTGTGNMFVVNGAAAANTIVWSETIMVVPNTDYNFSAWVASVLTSVPVGQQAQLQFSINGTLLGSVYSAPLTGGTWSNFYVTWNSGANTSAVITIVDQCTVTSGNDFALDDIFFQEVCLYSDTINVTINPNPAISTSALPGTICNGDSCELFGLSSITGTDFVWLPGNLSGNYQVVNPTSTTTYTVTGTIAGCSGSSTISIGVNPNPVISPSVNPSAICLGNSALLSASSDISGASFDWVPGNLNGSPVDVTPSGTTIYTVTGTTSGCTGTATVNLTVNPNPVVTITTIDELPVCVGNSVTLLASGATLYTWSSPPANTNSVVVTPQETYTITVYGESFNCWDTASIEIPVIICDLTIPNVITPNGYGGNEEFGIKGIKYFKNSTLLIYNRWGKKIFESDNYDCNAEDDGTISGSDCWNGGNASDGTYYYVLTVKTTTTERTFSGTITILR